MAADTKQEDSVYLYRVAQIEELGFPKEDAEKLAKATKLVSRKGVDGKLYFTDWPVSWHDVAKLIKAGASQEQVLRILL